jgi:branched-chain amino acid transport system permease protein
MPVPDMVASVTGAYYFTLAVTLVSLWILYRIIRSPFGMTFQAVRDNPERCRAIGVDVRRHQLVGMIIAGCFAGTAGALFMTVEGSVFPELMFWTLSLEILIMCLLGGWFTFLGPMLGAAIIVSLQTVVGRYTEYWTLVLGVVLMVLILVLPQGILGFFSERFFPNPGAVGRGHAAD